ncbi:FliG C-terminal domain-containing protein [Treponema sp.]|uniref:FliG C-terminal domain-containing protein n=1 Tax=Treponema sp. TaxID=166 RepID=UPI00298DF3CB|nr:FliG C-terminal domain-containing protein [Treponema sp.]MCQ2242262.1 hypothetical protein [Treponema sp.]
MIDTITINLNLEKTAEEIFRQKKILHDLLSSYLPESYLSEEEKKDCLEDMKAKFYEEENLSTLHEKFLLNDELVEVANKIAAVDRDSYRKIAYSDWDCIFEGKVFEFPDLVLLDDRGFQKVLRYVSMETIAVSMIGESHAVKDKFYRNVSKRVASDIKKLMFKKMNVVEQKHVLEKQGLILKAVHKLLKAGEICNPGEMNYDC